MPVTMCRGWSRLMTQQFSVEERAGQGRTNLHHLVAIEQGEQQHGIR
jgi:hypothetical protein